jgi:hypothetical protein
MAVAGFPLRRKAPCIRGRERDAHLDGSLEVSSSKRSESLRSSAQEQGQEPHADRLAEFAWDRRVDVR